MARVTATARPARKAAAEPAWCAPARDRATEANEARADERERIAAWLEDLAACYPIETFPPDSDEKTSIAGTACRHAYRNAADALRTGLMSEGGGLE